MLFASSLALRPNNHDTSQQCSAAEQRALAHTQIPSSTAHTPFAASAQTLSRAFDSDLGFPTNFRQNYNLIEEIGSGSFGTVYAAEDIESGETVAVKVRLLCKCSRCCRNLASLRGK